MFQGVYTALITPFKYGAVDYQAFKNIVQWQIESGVDGVVVGGSTGEGQSLTKDELLQLINIALEQAKGKIKVVANSGLNCTENSIELTKAVEELGVDGAMLVAPYYIKPTQEGLYQHFKAIHDLTNLPLMLYNNPGRTIADISNETVARLARLPRIMALKEGSRDPSRCLRLRAMVDSKFNIVSGDDDLTLSLYLQGAVGTVAVVSNIVPSLVVKLHNLWNQGNIKDVMELQEILFPFLEALFCQTNPIGVKYAASQFELCLPDVRLPLVELSETDKRLLRDALQVLKVKLYESD